MNKWFVAGINSGKERSVEILLNFISDGSYSIKVYEDKLGEEMTNLLIHKETVSRDKTLTVNMIANGGFCTVVE